LALERPDVHPIVFRCVVPRHTQIIRVETHRFDGRVQVKATEAIVWLTIALREPLRSRLDQDADVVPAIVDTGCTEGVFVHEWHLRHLLGLDIESLKAAGKERRIFSRDVPLARLDVWLHPFIALPNQTISALQPPKDTTRAVKLQLSHGVAVSTLESDVVVVAKNVRAAPQSSRQQKVGLLGRFFGLPKPASPEQAGVKAWEDRLRTSDERSDDLPTFIYPRLPVLGMQALISTDLSLNVDGRQEHFSIYGKKKVPSHASLGESERSNRGTNRDF
jgi:hypothetical protein